MLSASRTDWSGRMGLGAIALKHKSRGGTRNPLREYRRLQTEIRAIYDPFTQKHCPSCVTPCCVKPTRVTPFDVALAQGTGHTFSHLGDQNPYIPALEHAGHRLAANAVPLSIAPDISENSFCEYLNAGRCSFPDDLRPFGCTTYVCNPMYSHMTSDTLRRLRRLIRQLELTHATVQRALRDTHDVSSDDEVRYPNEAATGKGMTTLYDESEQHIPSPSC